MGWDRGSIRRRAAMNDDVVMLVGGSACMFAPMFVGMALFALDVFDPYSENDVFWVAVALAIPALAMCIMYGRWMLNRKHDDGVGSPRRHLWNGSWHHSDGGSQRRTCRRCR